MNKAVVVVSFMLGSLINLASADALKNSLSSMLNEKESSSMVNLSNLNLNAKSKPVVKKHKTRGKDAIVAVVNGHNILKKNADDHLSERTGGKIDNYDMLPVNQQKRLISEMILPFLAADAAFKELSAQEKQMVYTRTWMQKEARTVTITDEEVLKLYNQLKQQAKDNNETREIPPFEDIKERLRIQMIEKTMVEKLMENVKIEVL